MIWEIKSDPKPSNGSGSQESLPDYVVYAQLLMANAKVDNLTSLMEQFMFTMIDSPFVHLKVGHIRKQISEEALKLYFLRRRKNKTLLS